MSRIVSDKLVKIDLENGEYVEVRKSMTYEESAEFISKIDRTNELANARLPMQILEKCAKGWNILDDEGQPVPFSQENLHKLDTKTVTFLSEKLIEMYFNVEKKNPVLSEE